MSPFSLLQCAGRPYFKAEDRFKELSTNCTLGLGASLFFQVTAAPFAGSLFRRQQEADKEKRSGPEDGTGKPYSTKKLKETAKTSLRAKPPQFPFAVHSRPRREWRKASWGAVGSGTHCSCRYAVTR
ncbi:protein FAM228A-like [Heterocephalus glaber]|uniref:Protein FAM228A-like n=1 Tax=Heterocephalus glaber TaxID=10181 RepID=A0AAX6SL26_HETGA|nr:protein FAM228A-like [Heterocephalus glaber]